jgi:CBS domain-containing protein
MKVRNIYSPHILFVEAAAADTLRAVAARMRDQDVGTLAVLDKGRLVGIISERDLVQALAEGIGPDEPAVPTYMTENPSTVHPDDDSAEVATEMMNQGIRHMPVVDGDRILGMVSIRDLLPLEAWPRSAEAS